MYIFTFRSLQSNYFAVLAFAGAVERFYTSVVCAIEVQPVNGANGFRAAVHLLCGKTNIVNNSPDVEETIIIYSWLFISIN